MSVHCEDVSAQPRAGLKGPGAAAWLEALQLPLPAQANGWEPLPEGRILRLGISEFLIEGPLAARVQSTPPRGVYPVLREDCALRLSGTALNELLLQTCSVDFVALDPSHRPVVLTSMMGVSVIALPESGALRLWCDGTFGAWFEATLRSIATDLTRPPARREP